MAIKLLSLLQFLTKSYQIFSRNVKKKIENLKKKRKTVASMISTCSLKNLWEYKSPIIQSGTLAEYNLDPFP